MIEWKFEGTKLLYVSTNETNLVFPSNITETADGNISYSPFLSCRNTVINITFSQDSKLETLGEYFFSYTVSLINADLRNCLLLKNIYYCVFYNSSVEQIFLPENGILTSLLPGAFSGSNIKTLKIPDTVKSISSYDNYHGRGVFTSCSKLKKIEISENSNLETIGGAIGQFSAVESFFVPKKVTNFHSAALNHMYSLSSLIVDPSNSEYISIDDVIYDTSKTALVCCACNKKTPFKCEQTITKIMTEAFRGCRRTDEFIIPNGVTEILFFTFCDSLFSSVILPNTLNYIRQHTFVRTHIKSIRIPASVELIEGNGFTGTKLKKVYFEERSSKITISDEAFKSNNQLTTIIIPKENIEMNVEKAFIECPLSRISYIMKGYPTKRQDTGSFHIKYYAHIESSALKNDDNTNNNMYDIECGDVEVHVHNSFCYLQKCTQRNKRFRINNFFQISLLILIS